jgi:glycosyltransferase involved in cell wall biosynthesis
VAQLVRIGVIALSRIVDDPRVRRQCEVLQEAGFDVFAIGEEDERHEQVVWKVATSSQRELSDFAKSTKRAKQIVRTVLEKVVGRSLGRAIWRSAWAMRVQLCRLQPKYAQRIFWSWKVEINQLYEKAKPLQCDIWIANDWITLPIAARLAAENGGVYAYDSHEFALEEYQERLSWRLAQRPIVAALEKGHIGGAKLVTAVSSGIADRLTKIYQLPQAALTIRNTPRYIEIPFRATPGVIRVLYHGTVAPGRGLEAAIDSVQSWSPDRQLYIRGPGSGEYLASLRKRIENAALQSRVFLLPSVPMTELIAAAAEFDIGFFALPGHSLHNEYALPNKFFEYAMAGLALCVSELSEMSSLLAKYELGSTFAKVRPDLIAAAINAMSREKIDRFKKNSLVAAKELCWEAESKNFVSALTQLTNARA